MTPDHIATSRIRLHGCRTGSGPLVIFLHGITANWAVWLPILGDLAREATCVAISQRGHGKSDKPQSGYGRLDYAKDVHALIESLGLGPALVVGHSLGARNAVVAGALRPDLIRATVSIDFVPQVEAAALDLLKERVLKGARTFDSLEEIKAYLADRYKLLPPDAIERRALNGFARLDGKWSPHADTSAMAQTLDGLYENYLPEYEAIRVPTIAVRGALSTLVSETAFASAAAARPDISHVTVPRADHYVPEEAPREIAEIVKRLL